MLQHLGAEEPGLITCSEVVAQLEPRLLTAAAMHLWRWIGEVLLCGTASQAGAVRRSRPLGCWSDAERFDSIKELWYWCKSRSARRYALALFTKNCPVGT